MNLNETISLPTNKVLSRKELLSMESVLRRVRQSGEIHIHSTGAGLSFTLHNPHRSVDGDPLTDEELDARGVSSPCIFTDLEKIAICDTQIVLFPVRSSGKATRKRTLRFRRGWVATKRTHFSDFTIKDTP
ncbi:hypothetical protein [Marinobacter sp.]|jgi:hypothetical protein|uniref:hypothetical protein n=1 Tax=Marinobacter sp. TaxID=50741 RepID=UPI0026067A97|nr:hypothetical protein [Marinobacter sp.]